MASQTSTKKFITFHECLNHRIVKTKLLVILLYYCIEIFNMMWYFLVISLIGLFLEKPAGNCSFSCWQKFSVNNFIVSSSHSFRMSDLSFLFWECYYYFYWSLVMMIAFLCKICIQWIIITSWQVVIIYIHI